MRECEKAEKTILATHGKMRFSRLSGERRVKIKKKSKEDKKGRPKGGRGTY